MKIIRVNQPQREESIMTQRKRNLKLSDLERRVKMRKNVKNPNKKPLMKSIGSALQKFNKSFTKSVSTMPTGKQISDDLWGGKI